jgi:hypothetical protein
MKHKGESQKNIFLSYYSARIPQQGEDTEHPDTNFTLQTPLPVA